MSLNKTKLIIGLVLVPVTAIYGYLILIFTSTVFAGFLYPPAFFGGPFMLFLIVMGLFGVFGLIGLWLLFIFDNFENYYKRVITLIFIGMGAFAALSVSYISFSNPFGVVGDSILNFILTWGLWFLTLIVLFFAKRKLFPKL